MSTPPAKRLEITVSSNAPIVFESPGLKADLYLKVFNQEVHVTSIALKLYSGFFRTFLELSGGTKPYSNKPEFTSQWFTQLEDKDENTNKYTSWVLSSDHNVSIEYTLRDK